MTDDQIGFLIGCIIIIGILIVWWYIFRPLNVLLNSGELTNIIHEEILPDIQKSVNTLITLSSATLVLTFTILKFLSELKLIYLGLLRFSWITLAISILTGVLVLMHTYVLNAHSKATEKNLNEHINNNVDEELPKKLMDQLNVYKKNRNIYYIFLVAQGLTFSSSFTSLAIFAVVNF